MSIFKRKNNLQIIQQKKRTMIDFSIAFAVLLFLNIIRVSMLIKYKLIPKEDFEGINDKFLLVFCCIITPIKEEIQSTLTLIIFKNYFGNYYWMLNCLLFSINHIQSGFDLFVNLSQMIAVFFLRLILDGMNDLCQQSMYHIVYNTIVILIMIRCAKIQHCTEKKEQQMKKSEKKTIYQRERSFSFNDCDSFKTKNVYYGEDLKVKTKGDELIETTINAKVKNQFEINKKIKIS